MAECQDNSIMKPLSRRKRTASDHHPDDDVSSARGDL